MAFSVLKEAFPPKGTRLQPVTLEARQMLMESLKTGKPMVYDKPSQTPETDKNRLRKEGTDMGLSVQVRVLNDGRIAVLASRPEPDDESEDGNVTAVNFKQPK